MNTLRSRKAHVPKCVCVVFCFVFVFLKMFKKLNRLASVVAHRYGQGFRGGGRRVAFSGGLQDLLRYKRESFNKKTAL